MPLPRLAITLGEPSGIGPEAVARAVSRRDVAAAARLLIVGDPRFLPREIVRRSEILEVPAPPRIARARPSKAGGLAALSSLEAAARLALSGAVDGIVTSPASKISLAMAGARSVGHTEILRDICGARRVEMMMTAAGLRALLLTRHIPLSEVPRRVTSAAICSAAAVYFSEFGEKSRLCAAALNPHAGDGGILGDHEKKIISPAVARMARRGFAFYGPLPADAAFAAAARGRFDAVMAMYHDQALVALKVLSPRSVVNVTLGLPFVRTAPGHGTAFDIAGRGRADENPTAEAIKTAASLARAKKWKK